MQFNKSGLQSEATSPMSTIVSKESDDYFSALRAFQEITRRFFQ
jgi:uncharacterized protein YqgV (UPF0045/DUF77 family)